MCINQSTCVLNFQLVEKLRKVNFTLDDDKEEYKYFSEDGDFEEGYDVLLWDSGAARTIGKFNVHTKQVNIFSSSDIVWNVGPNNTVSTDGNPPSKAI